MLSSGEKEWVHALLGPLRFGVLNLLFRDKAEESCSARYMDDLGTEGLGAGI